MQEQKHKWEFNQPVTQLQTQHWVHTFMQVNQRKNKQKGKFSEIWSSSNISTVIFAMIISKTFLLGRKVIPCD